VGKGLGPVTSLPSSFFQNRTPTHPSQVLDPIGGRPIRRTSQETANLAYAFSALNCGSLELFRELGQKEARSNPQRFNRCGQGCIEKTRKMHR
jgi:hypothetical protein